LNQWALGCFMRTQIATKNQKTQYHDDGRHQTSQEHGVDRHTGNDGVHDQRHRRCQQHPQGAGAGDQADATSLRVTGTAQQRQEQAPQRQNGDTATPGEGRKKRAKRGGCQHRTRHATTQYGDEQLAQTRRRAGAREDQAGQREQGQGRQRWG